MFKGRSEGGGGATSRDLLHTKKRSISFSLFAYCVFNGVFRIIKGV